MNKCIVLWLVACAAVTPALAQEPAQQRGVRRGAAAAKTDFSNMVLKVDRPEGKADDSNLVIQRAIDVVAMEGGGTVELGPGVYTCSGVIRMRAGVRLVGAGEQTVLRRCDGPATRLRAAADYGQAKIEVADPTGFRLGMDIVVLIGDPNSRHDSPATITYIAGNTLYLDRKLISDYYGEMNFRVLSDFCMISFSGIYDAEVRDLCVDGNRAGNNDAGSWNLPGIHLFESRGCRVVNCVVKDVASDGITCETTQDITIDGCKAVHNKYFGIHFGSGAARPILRNSACIGNDVDGLYICHRVQEGRFENNKVSENGQHGISIGFRDTDNVFVGNTVSGNKKHGIFFRTKAPRDAPNGNTFRENTIQDNGECGVYVSAPTRDLLFERNLIGDTRPESRRSQRVGLCVSAGCSHIRCLGNTFGPHVRAATEGEIESQ